MLAELLAKLTELAKVGATPSVLSHTMDPRRAFVVANGACQEIVVPPPLRNHQLEDLPSFLSFVADEGICPNPEVYQDADQLVVLCDRNDRRDRGTLKLRRTARWQALVVLTKNLCAFGQKEVLRYLRHDLAVEGLDHVIAALRRLDFTRTSTGRAHVEHGRESLGRSVEAVVQNASEIPESFVVITAPYATLGANQTAEVRLSVELDIENQRVILRVLPDELANAERAIQVQVQNTIRTALPLVPLFTGSVI